eukprot:156309-Prorocentrum_minimum.AAC.1
MPPPPPEAIRGTPNRFILTIHVTPYYEGHCHSHAFLLEGNPKKGRLSCVVAVAFAAFRPDS